jgi:apolipoprotein N-acyltransferase
VTKYDKVHLAPFGEYIPLKGLLFFVEKITDEIGEFTPGTEIRNLILSGRRIATPICYELIYPRLVRDFIALGGELIVIASNDSWYGRSAAPHQLLAMSVFRSVENRRFTLRSTTSGISALISPTGVICERSGLDEKEALTVPFAYLNDRTVFTRFGFLFPHLCLVIAFLWLTSRVVRGWRRRHGLKAANSRSSSNSPQRAKNSSS